MTKEAAKNMRWHSDNRVNNGKLCYSANNEAWKDYDRRYPDLEWTQGIIGWDQQLMRLIHLEP